MLIHQKDFLPDSIIQYYAQHNWDNPICESVHETKGVVVPEVQTADSCFGLIGPRQCSAALGGPATSYS